jgi:putative membrane protein
MHTHHLALACLFFALSLLMPGSTKDELPLIDQPAREPGTDHQFLVRAIGCETIEVQLAELALAKSKQAGVLGLARKVLDAHRRLRAALVKTAEASKAGVSEKIDKTELERMKKLTGVDFDRAWVRHVLDEQEKEAVLYSKWSKEARDESLRKIAREATAVIKEHRPEAKRLQKRLASAS